jgi:hypothetical protein
VGARHRAWGCDIMITPAGILLPESTFQEPWFFYLSAFVAFNTIVFVGLSLAKLVMWPRPRIPDDTVPLAIFRRSNRQRPSPDLFPEPGPDPRDT